MAKGNAIILAMTLITATAVYLGFQPVEIDPIVWQPQADPGFNGDFAVNQLLSGGQDLKVQDSVGPEALTLGPDGAVYTGTRDGWVHRIADHNSELSRWLEVGHLVLGLEFHTDGNLYIANGLNGLVRVTPEKKVEKLLTEIDGFPIKFADDLDITASNLLFLSDASTKFTLEGAVKPTDPSILEIFEHRGHGRLIQYDITTGEAKVVMRNLVFANGVAIHPDQQSVLVVETGKYRILRYYFAGDKTGQVDIFVDNLPAFPDNIQRNLDGTFWVGLPTPRNPAADLLAPYPGLRKLVKRLPKAIQPKPQHYGMLTLLDVEGHVLKTLHDPSGKRYVVTGALNAHERIYVSSVDADFVVRLETSVLK